MQSVKRDFSHDVLYLIHSLCATAFGASSDDKLEKIFGVSMVQMEFVIDKVTQVLPEALFAPSYHHALEEIKNIFAREFIFFQVQEKWNDPHYQENLSNFIRIFARDIQRHVDRSSSQTFKMNKEF